MSLLPNGFRAYGIHAGIGSKKTKPDLAVFYSSKVCRAAGVFTTNRVQAAPVVLSRRLIRSKKSQAIVVNSGCANACTGKRGFLDAVRMSELVAEYFPVRRQNVLVASTGLIGEFLPMGKVQEGLKLLARKVLGFAGRSASSASAVRAMMTTDTFPKSFGKTFHCGGQSFKIWGCAKGSGMIHPDMATMLSFILTDADLSSPVMNGIFKKTMRHSFNALSVDGDTSTNDCVFLLANGLSGCRLQSGKELRIFENGLGEVCRFLSDQLVSDGEGATKKIEIFVKGARRNPDARKIARTVATSSLVKTAFFGEDANWGRIIAAVGRSGVRVHPEKIDIYFDRLCVTRGGCSARFSEKEAKRILKKKAVSVTIDLHSGKSEDRTLTCDFSLDYVKINADYRT